MFFSKILSFILVYILSIANFLVVLSPLTFLLLGKYFLAASSQGRYIESILFLSISSTSGLMLLFLFFDFCFSSSVRYYARRGILSTKKDEYNDISEAFEKVKNKYNKKDVQLYIVKSEEINAYAVGSLRRNIVVITTSLLNMYRSNTESRKEFLTCIECILSHEMSHIINKDYFTALLLIINEKANKFVSKIIWLFFMFIVRIFNIIPIIGQYVSIIVDSLYNALDFTISFFYKYIMLTLYKFIQLQISKNIEYRADRQGAQVMGGNNMANTLAMLGDSGYFSIFSSHPSTRNRVKSVSNINISNNTIRPVFGVNIIFLISFIFIISACYYSYKLAKVDSLIRDYYSISLFFKNKYIILKTRIYMLLNK